MNGFDIEREYNEISIILSELVEEASQDTTLEEIRFQYHKTRNLIIRIINLIDVFELAQHKNNIVYNNKKDGMYLTTHYLIRAGDSLYASLTNTKKPRSIYRIM